MDGYRAIAVIDSTGKGFEGIIAKRKTSVYRPGKRSPRLFENQNHAYGKNSPSPDSLREKQAASISARCCSAPIETKSSAILGFSGKGLKQAMKRLKPLFTDKSPVQNPPKILEKIQWVRPELVCEVAFASGGSLIEASYKIENSIKNVTTIFY